MRLILLFFWRDIISKLNINTIFKLQLKINFTDSIEEALTPNKILNTDSIKLRTIKLIKGFYPYQFKFKETSLIINTSSNLFNYMVTIKGVFIDGKKIIINRVSVTDKTFKFIFLNFIDIKSDFNPNSFVRIINNNQYVYKDGVKVLSQKRIKAKY